eukprot:TRINITY_DN452_c0_g1_i1.p1 TRINITY_DN452_c0_g1~~TRINITY_DN452_c0_g1_i1.p1  ORF type:complete len:602 (-),score=155.73 TRINITY_DN452_c0_g1_i1:145-1950(-)
MCIRDRYQRRVRGTELLKAMARALLSLLALALASANVYDVVLPLYQPAAGCKCASWTSVSSNATEQARIDATWLNGKPPADIGNACAMPGASAGEFECDGCTVDKIYNSFAGPWCYCESQGEQYCTPPTSVPEQINLQVAAPDVVVASFVTFEARPPLPTETPVAMFGSSETDLQPVQGVSHLYGHLSQAEHTNYTLHFIKFGDLEPRKNYYYKVKSGLPESQWSAVFEFRAPYASSAGGETRIGSYGDMGHSHYNAMGNLKDDCANGKVDAILHMGDHAYDMSNAGDKRGDAYMNSFQPALTGCPWIPVIGNHEGNDGDNNYRYLNMTFGETLGASTSSATSALGDLLSKTTLLGAGKHSGVPSNTSRYFSVDIGMIHIAAVDLNAGSLGDAQSAWLEADLAAVDRSVTPWVFGTSHFPLLTAKSQDSSAARFIGEVAEYYPDGEHSFVQAKCDSNGVCERTVGELLGDIQAELMPILVKHGVDVWNAGHVHDYESDWPVCFSGSTNSTDICKDSTGAPIKSFDHPKGIVHVTEGNGGVPGVVGKSSLVDCSNAADSLWCRKHGTGGAYGRWIAHDAHSLTYEHVQNNGGVVTDTFTISK